MISCQQNLNEQNLVGKWRITDFSTTAAISQSLIDDFKEFSKSTVYSFNSDETFGYVDIFTPNGKSGKRKINQDISQLQMQYDDDSSGEWEIIEVISFSKSKMIWKSQSGLFVSETTTLEKGIKL